MIIAEAREALALIATATPEDTRRAARIYPGLPLPEKTIIKSKARGSVFDIFGNAGIGLVTVDVVAISQSLAKAADFKDYYDWRLVEISVENAMCALLAKPRLKAEEFTMLMAPWAQYLGDEWTTTEGCGIESVAAPVKQAIESTKERRAREKDDARLQKQQALDAERDAKAIARAEKKKPETKPRAIDLIGAIAGITGLAREVPTALPAIVDSVETHEIQLSRKASENLPLPVAWHDGKVRVWWENRKSCWRLAAPRPSNALVVNEKFESPDAAREYAEAHGWEVTGVSSPRG